MELTEMENRMLYQTEGTERYAILQEMSMASQYAGDPAWRKATKDFMEKLRPLSDAGCMDLVRDIQKKYRLPQEGRTIGELIAETRQKSGTEKLKGYDIMALERFDTEVKHMIVFDVLSGDSLWVTRVIRCACSLPMPAIRTSSGKLPMGQTLERMKEGYSQIRNEALAYAFSYMNLSEHWGSGIPCIIGKLKAAGLREPEFIGGEVDLRINIYQRQISGTDFLRHSISDSIYAVKMPGNRRQTADKMPISEQEKLIFQYALENGGITTTQVTELLGIKQRRAREILVKMVEKKWLKKEGASRSTVYVINTERK